MSNINILNRLRQKFIDFKSNTATKDDFTDFLFASINALENKDDSVIEKARDFEYRFTTSSFSDEDFDIEGPKKVALDFDIWLDELNKIYR